MKNIRHFLTIATFLSLLVWAFSGVAAADSWSIAAPVISGYNWYGNVGVNQAGDATAVWLSGYYPYSIQSSSRKAGSAQWAAPLVIAPAPGAPWPQVFMDRSGNALALWNDDPGIFTAKLPAGSNQWQKPQLMTSATSYPNLSMDVAGDATLIWNGSGSILARTQPAGAGWGATVTLATAPAGSGMSNPVFKMSDDGSVVLAYQTYQLNTRRRAFNFQIYTTRRNGLNGKWTTPVPVGGVTPPSQVINGHQIGLAVDAAGHSVLVADQLTTQINGLLEATIQNTGATTWSPPTTISPAGTALAGVVSDAAGNLTVAFQTLIAGNGVLQASTGSITTNLWGKSVQISPANVYAWKPGLAGNSAGGVLAFWTVFDPVFYTDLKVQTATLARPHAAWNAPLDLFYKGANYSMTSPIIGIDGQERAFAVWDVSPIMGYPHVITFSVYTP